MARIVIKGLRKRFGAKRVLDGVDLVMEEGESLVVLGPSGCGKSVLVKCILGLLEADGGSVTVDGEEMLGAGARRREAFLLRCGMLFQGAALFDSLPVWRNVAFALLQRGEAKTAALARAGDCLRQVGLGADAGALYPVELSGGMKKRVGLARAIASRPSVMFFDEPTTGLDPMMGAVIDRLLRASVDDLRATTLTITHDIASAQRIADRMAMLHQGRIVWSGAKDTLMHSGNPFVDQFVHGRSEGPINLLS